MKKTRTTLVSAAVTGLFMGTTATTFTACSGMPSASSSMELEKHACKTLNSCQGKGGCSSSANGCKGKNDCKGQGGCATVSNECRGHNDCKGQGGCKTATNSCKGQNDCKNQGGCKVTKH